MSNNNYSFQSFSSFSSFSSNQDSHNKTSEGKGFYLQDLNGKRKGQVYYQKSTPHKQDKYSRQMDENELKTFFQMPRTIQAPDWRLNSFTTDNPNDSSINFPLLMDSRFKKWMR
jgi:hypothetical protein